MPTHYEVLGIEQEASREEVRKAYLSLMRVVHPDSPARTLNHLIINAADVNSAYAGLKDPRARLAYDEKLALDRFPLRLLPRAPQPSALTGSRTKFLTCAILLIAMTTWHGLTNRDETKVATGDNTSRGSTPALAALTK